MIKYYAFFVLLMFAFNIYLNIKNRYKDKHYVDFVDVDIIDNQAQWVYNNNLYYANVVDGKIDTKNTRKMKI